MIYCHTLLSNTASFVATAITKKIQILIIVHLPPFHCTVGTANSFHLSWYCCPKCHLLRQSATLLSTLLIWVILTWKWCVAATHANSLNPACRNLSYDLPVFTMSTTALLSQLHTTFFPLSTTVYSLLQVLPTQNVLYLNPSRESSQVTLSWILILHTHLQCLWGRCPSELTCQANWIALTKSWLFHWTQAWTSTTI